ncbi:MAG: dihydropteroate synthase, partial [Candidatus Rokuibacteriota bacterium]
LASQITASEEAERLAWAVGLLASKVGVPISADTSRAMPARAALDAGAQVINDVTGLTGDAAMAPLLARAGAGLILMASERRRAREGVTPFGLVGQLLAESLGIARGAGIDPSLIVVDPGIGFFRNQAIAWPEWDCAILAGLRELRDLGRPLAVGVSRKSFIGALAAEPDPTRRLPGSLAATAVAVLNGAHLIRAHDVAETMQAIKVAHAIRRAWEER